MGAFEFEVLTNYNKLRDSALGTQPPFLTVFHLLQLADVLQYQLVIKDQVAPDRRKRRLPDILWIHECDKPVLYGAEGEPVFLTYPFHSCRLIDEYVRGVFYVIPVSEV